MRVLFALVAWGRDYVRDFLDVSLPTLLAEGNLADADGLDGSRLLILTTPADVAAFEADPNMRSLKRTLPIEFIDISRFRGRDKYRFASRCQVEALRRSEDFDAVILLYPDMIWCRGGVRFAVERIGSGALAVFSPAPAVLPEPTLAALRADADVRGRDDRGVISIPPRKLAGIAIRHHHPMWNAFDWDGGCFAHFPSCLRWNIPNHEGWLIRCFHLHPVALRVQRDNPRFLAAFTTSLDGEYVPRLFDGSEDLAFATDTDSFAMVTLRDGKMGPFPHPGNKPSVSAVAQWAEANAFLLHRAFADTAFRWHEEPISEASWQSVEQRSQSILAQIRNRLHTPDSIIRIEDPDAYRARRERAHNPASRGAPTIELPPAYARQPRAQLTAALFNNMAYRAVLGMKEVLGRGLLGRWLRQQPSAVSLWQRTRQTFQPESPMHAAASTRSLLRNILAPKR